MILAGYAKCGHAWEMSKGQLMSTDKRVRRIHLGRVHGVTIFALPAFGSFPQPPCDQARWGAVPNNDEDPQWRGQYHL
jgi:hypothetical protein